MTMPKEESALPPRAAETFTKSWTPLSSNPLDVAGMASFSVAGFNYTVRLDTYSDFTKIGHMLERARIHGQTVAFSTMRDKVHQVTDDLVRANGKL